MNTRELIILGATGHLSQQKLLPAVRSWRARNSKTELLLYLVGRGKLRDPQDNEVTVQIESYSDLAPLAKELPKELSERRVFYLALPPDQILTAIRGLSEAGLLADPKSGVAIEKPFGSSLETAQELWKKLAEHVDLRQLYLVDHYLGKETVQNILAFRFDNGAFAPLWSNSHVDHVQITVAEDGGIAERAAYYDKAGAIHDFLQNHLLQLVAYLTMERPEGLKWNALSDAKLAALKAITCDTSQTVIGQYEGYLQEKGVAEQSQTETFVATVLEVANDRWRGVPFYVRTGKGLARRVAEISVVFKASKESLFGGEQPQVLTFRIQPDEGIGFTFNVKELRQRMRTQVTEMTFCYPEVSPDAYEQLLDDVLDGDTLFALRSDVIEESWRITEQLTSAIKEWKLPLRTYPVGSWGP